MLRPGRRPRLARQPAMVTPALAAVVLMAGCASSATVGSPTPTPTRSSETTAAAHQAALGDTIRLVDIGGGRSIVLRCSGSGSPLVVLISGLGETSGNWTVTADPSQADQAVFPQVARTSRVCAYDRPGTGTSGATGWQLSASTLVPQPTNATRAADDLQAVLTAGGEPAPYVLVGHSLGGVIARVFVAAHPRSVVGLVLDDALAEGLVTRLTPTQSADFERLNSPAVQGRPPGSETFETSEMVAELKAVTSGPVTPPVPTVVLSADRKVISSADIATGQLPAFVDQAFADALWAAQLAAQAELAARYPGATHVTKTGSGHYIHVEQPRLVDDAITRVVTEARGQVIPTP